MENAAAAAEVVPTHYGGITKEAWELKDDGSLHAVPYFWVASTADAEPTGVLATQDAVGQAAAALLQKLPPALAPSGAVGAFPCFTRGVNQYGAEHVEPDELSAALPGVRLYGMFAHGELGPSAFAGFAGADTPAQPCTQHSMHTVLAVHTTASVKEELSNLPPAQWSVRIQYSPPAAKSPPPSSSRAHSSSSSWRFLRTSASCSSLMQWSRRSKNRACCRAFADAIGTSSRAFSASCSRCAALRPASPHATAAGQRRSAASLTSSSRRSAREMQGRPKPVGERRPNVRLPRPPHGERRVERVRQARRAGEGVEVEQRARAVVGKVRRQRAVDFGAARGVEGGRGAQQRAHAALAQRRWRLSACHDRRSSASSASARARAFSSVESCSSMGGGGCS